MEQMKKFTCLADFRSWADTLPDENDVYKYPVMMDRTDSTSLFLTKGFNRCPSYSVALFYFFKAFKDTVPNFTEWIRVMVNGCGVDGKYRGKKDGCYSWSVKKDNIGWHVHLTLFGEYAGK